MRLSDPSTVSPSGLRMRCDLVIYHATFMENVGDIYRLCVYPLQEYGGNLDEAVNAHFTEGIHQTSVP